MAVTYTEVDDPTVYVEVAYPQFARWTIVQRASDGWVMARETGGQVLSFKPGELRPLEA